MKYDLVIENGTLMSYTGPILDCDKVVTVPEGVTAIEKRAFWYRRALKGVSLPGELTSVGEEAFGMCEGLQWIKMPERMTELGERAFYHCASLMEIEIPEGIKEIHTNTFLNCQKLTKVTLPRTLTLIDLDAFAGCIMLSEVIYHGTEAEWEDVYKSFRWHGSVVGLRVICTAYDKNHKSDPKDFVIKDGTLVSYKSKDFTAVIPEGVTVIGRNAFSGIFSSIYRAILPEGVTRIETRAFSYQGELKELFLPRSLTCIEEDAFYFSEGVRRVVYGGTVEEWKCLDGTSQLFFSPYTVECIDGTLVE